MARRPGGQRRSAFRSIAIGVGGAIVLGVLVLDWSRDTVISLVQATIIVEIFALALKWWRSRRNDFR